MEQTIDTDTKVLFEPFPKQSEFIEAVFSGQYKYLLYGGAAGGGKTFVAMATLITLCKIYPKSKWYVVRESLPTLKQTTIPSFWKLCPTNYLYKFNNSEYIAMFKNGSQIIFFAENYYGDKDLTRFDGLEANGFVLEEAQELQLKTFEKCKLRAGRNILPKQPSPLIILTCNPSQGWLKETFHMPMEQGELPDSYYYQKATIEDNPKLPEDYLENLENLDEYTYRRFVKGDWNVTLVDRPFAYSFNEEKTVRPCEVKKKIPLYLSFDFNIDPITCIVCQHDNKSIRVLKEMRLLNSNIYELCERLLAELGDHYFIVTGDATGSATSALTRGSLNYYQVITKTMRIRSSQIKVPTKNPSLQNSRVLTNAMLSRHEDLHIDPSCKYLIDDLKYVEVNDKGEIDKAKDKHKTHLLDCLRYYLYTFHSSFLTRKL